MTGTLKYFISLILVALVNISSAQDKLERQVFIRAGLDLSRFALPYMYDFNLSGAELSLDAEVNYDLFPTIEAGFNTIKDYNDLHHYDLNGTYFRFGLNYNMLNYKHRLDRNIFFVGARYALANYSHEASIINIENGWGLQQTSMPKTSLRNHWFEGVIGLRGEIITNFYMGFTIRVKTMVIKPDYGSFKPFWIPGYGKATKTATLGLSYSVFYAIPIKNPELDFKK